jgi:hypothetical protein
MTRSSERKLLNISVSVRMINFFSHKLFQKRFLLSRIWRGAINVCLCLCKILLTLVRFRQSRTFSHRVCKSSEINVSFHNPHIVIRVIPCVRTDGQTAITTLMLTFLKFAKVPGMGFFVICFKTFNTHVRTLISLKVAELSNDETVVVNCYDVVSTTLSSFKGGLNECLSVDKFPWNYNLELHFVGLIEFAYYLLTVFQIQR